MKVVTTSGVNLKGGGDKDSPLTEKQANDLAAQKNAEAKALGLEVRYEAVKD